MADFADFALKIATDLGMKDQLLIIFDKLSSEQSTFIIEEDTIFQLLNIWSENPTNVGREITNTALCNELSEIADKQKIPFEYKGKTRAFAQRMTNLRENLREFFIITERKASGNKKLFGFTHKEEI
jgi:hypothetical protein